MPGSATELIRNAIGWADGEPSDRHTVDLLWALARFTTPKVAVEAGTYHGHTALALAHALHDADRTGHVWTADTSDSSVLANAAQLGLADRVTFFRGDFLDMLPTVTGPIEFAYLDAGPDNGGLRWRHFQGLQPYLAPGALVATDDIEGNWPKVEEFRRLGFYFPQFRGLSLWQKPL